MQQQVCSIILLTVLVQLQKTTAAPIASCSAAAGGAVHTGMR